MLFRELHIGAADAFARDARRRAERGDNKGALESVFEGLLSARLGGEREDSPRVSNLVEEGRRQNHLLGRGEWWKDTELYKLHKRELEKLYRNEEEEEEEEEEEDYDEETDEDYEVRVIVFSPVFFFWPFPFRFLSSCFSPAARVVQL